jgi:hypothetical protein
MTTPNLAGIIRKEDVYKKGTGNFSASYVPWARIAQLLHEHASGWDFHLKPTADGGLIHQAPDGTGYVLGYFAGPDAYATSDFPFPCMDHRNNPIPFDKVSARTLTDTHRRALCAAAAFHFSLGSELWAKQELENAGIAADVEQSKTQHKKDSVAALPAEDDDKPASKVVQAGRKAIAGATSLEQLEAVTKRLMTRHEAGDLTDEEHQGLLQLLLDRETQLTTKK